MEEAAHHGGEDHQPRGRHRGPALEADAGDGLAVRPPGGAAARALPDDLTESELRALDIDLSSPAAPLDVEDESARQQSVQAAIDGALEGADVAPPGPVVLDGEPLPAGPPDDARRLLLQVRGLVMQLSDAQQQVVERDMEIERLREELETTREALERALRNS